MRRICIYIKLLSPNLKNTFRLKKEAEAIEEHHFHPFSQQSNYGGQHSHPEVEWNLCSYKTSLFHYSILNASYSP
jgi:hypothetical protein